LRLGPSLDQRAQNQLFAPALAAYPRGISERTTTSTCVSSTCGAFPRLPPDPGTKEMPDHIAPTPGGAVSSHMILSRSHRDGAVPSASLPTARLAASGGTSHRSSSGEGLMPEAAGGGRRSQHRRLAHGPWLAPSLTRIGRGSQVLLLTHAGPTHVCVGPPLHAWQACTSHPRLGP
jgi:hypothetical protein